MAASENEKSALVIRRLMTCDMAKASEISPNDYLFDAPGIEAIAAECAGVVLTAGGEERAATLLANGAPFVFLGEAALIDSEALVRLAQLNPGRVGVYAPVRRQPVSWSFETSSNADFKTVTPSVCEPAWEILKADGSPTGTQAGWWLKAICDLGASQFLVQANVRDDADLNVLAGLVEDLGETLWISPRDGERLPLTDWIAYGHCYQLALTERDYERQAELIGEFLQPPIATCP